MNDALWYIEIARTAYPEDYADIIKSHGKDGPQIAAETIYIYEHNRVPEWAVFIESFEIVNGNYLLIHRDPNKGS